MIFKYYKNKRKEKKIRKKKKKLELPEDRILIDKYQHKNHVKKSIEK